MQVVLWLCQLMDVVEVYLFDLYVVQCWMVVVVSLEVMVLFVLLLDEFSWDFDVYWLIVFEYWLVICWVWGISVVVISYDVVFIWCYFLWVVWLENGRLLKGE